MKWSVFFIVTLIVLIPPPLLFSGIQSSDDRSANFEESTNHRLGGPREVRVALYNGSGAWQYGVIALINMFEWMDCNVTTVRGDDIKSASLDDFDALVWPGGDYVAYLGEMGLEGKVIVQDFISDGGGYMGICAGAYYACDYIVWMGDPAFPDPPYKVEGDELNLDLFSGVAYGPIDEIAEWNSDEPCTMTRVNLVDHTHPITNSLPQYMQILYYGGPYLQPYNGSNVTVLGRYSVTGTPAIVAFQYGDGRVFLTGPHPEIEEDSERDGWEAIPEFSDEGSDWPLLWKALNWLTQIDGSFSTDLNQDGTVNILDISIVAIAFGSKEGDEHYNVLADFDENNEVNILDVSIVAMDYGKTV